MRVRSLGTLPNAETGEPTEVGVDTETGLLVAIKVVDELSRLRTKRALKALRPLRYGSAYEEETS